ncbi:D-xylose 1-dehydrogenase (NADP(+)) [Diplonema papillatum]|nr:D-xylose 1-dehydrogenase (NADP(+)) [Diplonema papillatum]
MKWGVLSTGAIANDFSLAIKAAGGTLHACASRSAESAEKFAQKLGFEKWYASYEELARDDECDVIYIATPHNLHRDNILLCVAAGRNIVCEKPLCATLRQAEECTAAARRKGVFLMEGMWTRFFPATRRALEEYRAGSVGEAVMLNASFGFKADAARANPRLYRPELAGGAVLDIGVYAVAWLTMFLGEPDTVHAIGTLSDTGVDSRVSAQLSWGGKSFAAANITFDAALPNTATLCGTKGSLSLPKPFHAPETLVITKHETEQSETVYDPLDPPDSTKRAPGYNFNGSQGFMYEVRAVEQALSEGLKEHPLMTHSDTLVVARVMDKMLKQVGVKYPFE